MGDYPVLPAKSLKSGEELHKIVDDNKEQLLGKTCIDKFGGVVPFLPKVDSVFFWNQMYSRPAEHNPDPVDIKGLAITDTSQQGARGAAAQTGSREVYRSQP